MGAPTLLLDGSKLKLASSNVLVLDATAGNPIYSKAADRVTPIASVTKLMTAMVVLDAGQPLDEIITVAIADLRSPARKPFPFAARERIVAPRDAAPCADGIGKSRARRASPDIIPAASKLLSTR